jgi:hypothetical protein
MFINPEVTSSLILDADAESGWEPGPHFSWPPILALDDADPAVRREAALALQEICLRDPNLRRTRFASWDRFLKILMETLYE